MRTFSGKHGQNLQMPYCWNPISIQTRARVNPPTGPPPAKMRGVGPPTLTSGGFPQLCDLRTGERSTQGGPISH